MLFLKILPGVSTIRIRRNPGLANQNDGDSAGCCRGFPKDGGFAPWDVCGSSTQAADPGQVSTKARNLGQPDLSLRTTENRKRSKRFVQRLAIRVTREGKDTNWMTRHGPT